MKKLFRNRMVLESAKIYDAKARIFLIQNQMLEIEDLETLRVLSNEISALDTIIESNISRIKKKRITRAFNEETVLSKMNNLNFYES